MPIPVFQSLILPALKAFTGGSETSLSEVRTRIAAAEELTPEDMREMLPSGRQPVFTNLVSWAVMHMERAGLLERVRRAVYQLTVEGERRLEQAPGRVDLAVLRTYPAYAEWSKKAHAPPPGKNTAPTQPDESADTPEESLGPCRPATARCVGSRCAEPGSHGGTSVSRTSGDPPTERLVPVVVAELSPRSVGTPDIVAGALRPGFRVAVVRARWGDLRAPPPRVERVARPFDCRVPCHANRSCPLAA